MSNNAKTNIRRGAQLCAGRNDHHPNIKTGTLDLSHLSNDTLRQMKQSERVLARLLFKLERRADVPAV